jgi:hypothetical protein
MSNWLSRMRTVLRKGVAPAQRRSYQVTLLGADEAGVPARDPAPRGTSRIPHRAVTAGSRCYDPPRFRASFDRKGGRVEKHIPANSARKTSGGIRASAEPLAMVHGRLPCHTARAVHGEYTIRLRDPGPRPAYYLVADHLWGRGCNIDSDGNGATPDDTSPSRGPPAPRWGRSSCWGCWSRSPWLRRSGNRDRADERIVVFPRLGDLAVWIDDRDHEVVSGRGGVREFLPHRARERRARSQGGH